MNALKTSEIKITPEPPFNFKQTLKAHGWVELLPDRLHTESQGMERIQQLSDGNVIQMHISANNSLQSPQIFIKINHSLPLTSAGTREIIQTVRHMFRLDEDFSGLYKLAEKNGGHFKAIKKGFGHLLRSPTVFEDLIKTICTTNIQWAGTKRMVKEIVDAFGKPFSADPEKKSFPSAQDITGNDFKTFISYTNLGYRAEYIYSLANLLSQGQMDVESFIDPAIKTEDLKRKLLAIKGIGNYAAATMLMLLGHYDALPVDSVFREFIFAQYFNGKRVPQAQAEKIYKDWGKWKYLAYWYDLTRK